MYCLTIAGTGTSLDAFNFPNLAGLASGYTASAVPITTGTGTLGLPNLVVGTGNVVGAESLGDRVYSLEFGLESLVLVVGSATTQAVRQFEL